MENVMAIDIGNGFCKAAILYDNLEEPKLLIHDKMGMSSVAYVSADGNIVVAPKTRPLNCYEIRNVKTYLKSRTIECTIGETKFNIEAGKVYGAIARELINRANQTLIGLDKAPVYKVLVTYPASFTHSDDPVVMTKNIEIMKSSIEELELDGHKLEVVKMIPEPVAAAYDAVNFERNLKDKPVTASEYNIAVYDLGHGTFDVAVVTSTNNQTDPFDVVCQDGDPAVGGRVFDEKIYEVFCKQLGVPEECTLTLMDIQELRKLLINVKHSLSTEEKVYENFMPSSSEEYKELGMTKTEFESLICTDLNSTFECMVRTLDRAKKQGVAIDEIVLTGGSSQIPVIEKKLSESFGPNITVRGFRHHEGVVCGAARYAYNLEDKPLKQHAEFSYGIYNDATTRVDFVVPSSSELPAKSSVYAVKSEGYCIEIRVCRSKVLSCESKSLLYKECREVRRFKFNTRPNEHYNFYITVDDTHKVTVECEYPDGKKVKKSKFDD